MPRIKDLRLERPTPADAEEWAVLCARSFVNTYPNEAAEVSLEWCVAEAQSFRSPEAIAERRRRITYGLTNPDKFLLVARAGGLIVGALEGYSASDTGHQELQAVDAHPTGQGVGTALIDSFLDWTATRVSGLPVELEVAEYNEGAIRLYERYNFHEMPGYSRMLYGVIPAIRMQQAA